MVQQFGSMSVQNNWSSLWGQEGVNLLADRNIKTKTVDIVPGQDTRDCNRNVMRSTLQKVPETASLLQKSRLPFGLLIHPFCDYEVCLQINRKFISKMYTVEPLSYTSTGRFLADLFFSSSFRISRLSRIELLFVVEIAELT